MSKCIYCDMENKGNIRKFPDQKVATKVTLPDGTEDIAYISQRVLNKIIATVKFEGVKNNEQL